MIRMQEKVVLGQLYVLLEQIKEVSTRQKRRKSDSKKVERKSKKGGIQPKGLAFQAL